MDCKLVGCVKLNKNEWEPLSPEYIGHADFEQSDKCYIVAQTAVPSPVTFREILATYAACPTAVPHMSASDFQKKLRSLFESITAAIGNHNHWSFIFFLEGSGSKHLRGTVDVLYGPSESSYANPLPLHINIEWTNREDKRLLLQGGLGLDQWQRHIDSHEEKIRPAVEENLLAKSRAGEREVNIIDTNTLLDHLLRTDNGITGALVLVNPTSTYRLNIKFRKKAWKKDPTVELALSGAHLGGNPGTIIGGFRDVRQSHPTVPPPPRASSDGVMGKKRRNTFDY
jgi:hypothetical protein